MNDIGTITPFGPANLRVDPIPPRDSMAGSGGMFVTPNHIAIRLPAPESAEEWTAADDARKLAQASPGDLKRLAKEADRLAHAERVVAAAEASHVRAREAVIAMRVYGKPAAKAEETLARAEASVAKSQRDLGITREVHERLRKQIIASVRASLAATAHGKLRVARELYDDALVRLGQTSALLDAMRTARAAETIAAQELAAALGVTPGIANGKRAESATGSAYRTIGDDFDLVALVINQTAGPVTIGHDPASHLARRSGPSE